MIKNKKYIPVDFKIDAMSLFSEGKDVLIVSGNNFYKLSLADSNLTELELDEELSFSKSVKAFSDNKFIIATASEIYFAKINATNIVIEKNIATEADGYKPIVEATEDGKVVAFALGSSIITVLDEKTNKSETDGQKIWSIALSNDGNYLAIGTEFGKIQIRKSDTLELIKEFETGKLMISLSFSPNNKNIICGDDYAKIYSFNLDSGERFDYENLYSKKTVSINWQSETSFVIAHLSSVYSQYELNNKDGRFTEIPDFNTRYFQHSGFNKTNNQLVLSVEDLRNKSSAVPEIPTSYLVAVLDI